MFWPSMSISPLVGCSRATMWRRSVVFPAPEPPMMTVVSRRFATIEMPRRTSVLPYDFRTSFSVTMPSGGGPRGASA
jgi:hypothetical protein